MARFSGVVLAQDIGTPDRVSMGNEPASRAAIDAPLRFMPLHAKRTGLARIRFINHENSDANRGCLVGDVLALPSVRPQANLLLALGSETLAICHITYIPDHHGRRSSFLGEPHGLAAAFVFQVTSAASLLRQKAGLALLQSFPTPGAPLLARLLPPDLSEAFGGILLVGSHGPAGDNDRFLAIGQSRRMNFTQINRHNRHSSCRFCCSAILDDQMPHVVTRRPVPDEPCFQESRDWQMGEMSGQGDLDRGESPRTRQGQRSCLLAYACVLPDRGAKAFAFVGIVHLKTQYPAGFGRLAGFVEALLGGIPAMGVKRGRASCRVLYPLAAFGGKPDLLLAIATIVLDEHIRVDAPAFCIERIGLALGQGTDNLHGSEHLEFSTSFWLPQKDCFPSILFLCRSSGHIPRKDVRAEALFVNKWVAYID